MNKWKKVADENPPAASRCGVMLASKGAWDVYALRYCDIDDTWERIDPRLSEGPIPVDQDDYWCEFPALPKERL